MFWRTRKTITEAVERVVRAALKEAEGNLAQIGNLTALRAELETLRIEKDRREEEYARRDREIEHKVGLERQRQVTEIGLAKREATLGAQEVALKLDRKRFEDQLEFHEKRFTAEVGYLKDLIGDLAKRLPEIRVKETRRGHS